jgi:uncharacterized RDD family membrane protein YckC
MGTPATAPLYATIPPRLNALVLDGIVLLIVMGVLAWIGTLLDLPAGGRGGLFGLILGVGVLYEPILVARFGATLGHRWQDLRVVGADGGPPSFGVALLRFIVKAVLGIIAFFTIPSTARHQGIHDLVAGTTVQRAGRSGARSAGFVPARPVPTGTLPSPWLRLGVIVGYEIVLFALVSVLTGVSISDACGYEDRCSGAETLFLQAAGILWLVAAITTIVFGWTGRLWGARRRVEMVP